MYRLVNKHEANICTSLMKSQHAWLRTEKKKYSIALIECCVDVTLYRKFSKVTEKTIHILKGLRGVLPVCTVRQNV
jgi:hypothetical protein